MSAGAKSKLPVHIYASKCHYIFGYVALLTQIQSTIKSIRLLKLQRTLIFNYYLMLDIQLKDSFWFVLPCSLTYVSSILYNTPYAARISLKPLQEQLCGLSTH